MPSRKNVVSVQLDCASLAWATRHLQTEKDWADWAKTFVESLATNRGGINDFADSLIAGVHEYREEKAEQMRIFRGNKQKDDVTEHSYVTEHSTTSSLVLSSLKEAFDLARKSFPGKKRGLDVEWAHFLKHHRKNAKEIVPLLFAGVKRYADRIQREKIEARYIKHFQGWITESRWTEEDAPPPEKKPYVPSF